MRPEQRRMVHDVMDSIGRGCPQVAPELGRRLGFRVKG